MKPEKEFTIYKIAFIVSHGWRVGCFSEEEIDSYPTNDYFEQMLYIKPGEVHAIKDDRYSFGDIITNYFTLNDAYEFEIAHPSIQLQDLG